MRITAEPKTGRRSIGLGASAGKGKHREDQNETLQIQIKVSVFHTVCVLKKKCVWL